jgi:hypothetical protein
MYQNHTYLEFPKAIVKLIGYILKKIWEGIVWIFRKIKKSNNL